MAKGSKAHHRASARAGFRSVAAVLAGMSALMVPAGDMRRAFAAGDVRALTLFHTHTKETATVTFWRDGKYDDEGLDQLNWFLRDWRVNEPAKMDPHLFTILWEVYREAGSRAPINIISAYRSPATNAALRHRSNGVSEHSQHMIGKAMDIRLPDVDTARLRAVAMRMQYGGVGFYPSSAFVHVDTGSVRAWPRMSQDQLARLFPDGKTVHLPSNGKPLARYEEAKAEILSRNRVLASAGTGGSSLAGLFGSLFARNRAPQEPPEITTASLPSQGDLLPRMESATPLPPPRPQGLTADPAEAPAASPIDQNPTSRLLFSGVSIIAAPIQSDPATRAVQATKAIPLDYLRAPAGRVIADAFSAQPGDDVSPDRFVSRAARALQAWRMAQATP